MIFHRIYTFSFHTIEALHLGLFYIYRCSYVRCLISRAAMRIGSKGHFEICPDHGGYLAESKVLIFNLFFVPTRSTP